MIEKYRDISMIDFGDRILTVACDSCGGVGMLDGDVVKADGFSVGYHTAFVALAETIAIGSEPLLIVDTLSVSLGSYGKSILSGVKAAAKEAGLDPSVSVTGSSEENFLTPSTGIGVTVLGQTKNKNYKPKPINKEYDAVLIGIPHIGNEVLKSKSEILSLQIIKTLIKENSVLDLVPAGSKGSLFEAKQMALDLVMNYRENLQNPDIIRKSAGPATCAVAAVIPGNIELLKKLIEIPIIKIGSFMK